MTTKWGCLGAGKIANDFFTAIKDNLSSEEHEFVAVAARDIKRAQALAEKLGFKKAYDSYEKLAYDAEVDVVYVSTIHPMHAEHCIQMMNAGKHVLCEKPMTMNLKQAKQVLVSAKKNDVFFMEGIWSRFLPVYGQLRKELADQTIGKVKLLRADFCLPLIQAERLRVKELGGGACLDIGCYVVALACMVFGDMPESITAVGNLMSTGVDENACVILKYKDGAMANLVYHVNVGVGENNAVIYGEKGNIQVGCPHWAATKLSTPSRSYEFPLKEGTYNFLNTAGLHYEAAAVRKALLSGARECTEASHEQSIMIMAIMDEIRRQLGVRYSVD